MLSPSPPSSVDCVELKLECITPTLHRGGRGEGRCLNLTSYCVGVPRVSTRVVVFLLFLATTPATKSAIGKKKKNTQIRVGFLLLIIKQKMQNNYYLKNFQPQNIWFHKSQWNVNLLILDGVLGARACCRRLTLPDFAFLSSAKSSSPCTSGLKSYRCSDFQWSQPLQYLSLVFARAFNKGKTLILQTSPLTRSLTDPSSP